MCGSMTHECSFVLDNFADSDFDCLEKFGSSKGARSSLRDSVLLKFDPLLARPTIHQPEQRLPAITQEEDDYVADLELKIPQQDANTSGDTSADSTISPNASVQERLTRHLKSAENEMSVDIMKDINFDNKISEANNVEGEETKFR